MKTINKLRVRNLNGTFDQEIPFGVESSAMARPSGELVEDALKRADSTASKAAANEKNIVTLNQSLSSKETELLNRLSVLNENLIMLDNSLNFSEITEIIVNKEGLNVQFYANDFIAQVYIRGSMNETFTSEEEEGVSIFSCTLKPPVLDYQKIVSITPTKCAKIHINSAGDFRLGPIYNIATGEKISLDANEEIYISETFLVNLA